MTYTLGQMLLCTRLFRLSQPHNSVHTQRSPLSRLSWSKVPPAIGTDTIRSRSTRRPPPCLPHMRGCNRHRLYWNYRHHQTYRLRMPNKPDLWCSTASISRQTDTGGARISIMVKGACYASRTNTISRCCTRFNFRVPAAHGGAHCTQSVLASPSSSKSPSSHGIASPSASIIELDQPETHLVQDLHLATHPFDQDQP